MTYTFQKAHVEDVNAVFALYEKRIYWMDEVGIRQWNIVDYLLLYPIGYYAEQQALGTLYVLKESSRIIGAAILLQSDDRWSDKADVPAYYVHNLVTEPTIKGAGKTMLAEIEKLAVRQKKHFLRLDCAADNDFLNRYYDSMGFALSGQCKEGVYTGNRREKVLQGKQYMINIRIAGHTDAEQLALIAEKTFRETFAAFNTKEDMDKHCKKSYGAEIQQHEITDTDKCTLLCESDNQIVGYAQINWHKTFDGIQGAPQAEIQRIYIEKDRHGTGAAQELMRIILDTVRQRNIRHVWLGVWEKNPRAIAFYKKFGFAEVGEHVFLLGSDPQRDIILHKVLEV